MRAVCGAKGMEQLYGAMGLHKKRFYIRVVPCTGRYEFLNTALHGMPCLAYRNPPPPSPAHVARNMDQIFHTRMARGGREGLGSGLVKTLKRMCLVVWQIA